MTNYDGSIVLSTQIDTSGINKGISQIKSQFGSLNSIIGKLGTAIGLAFSVRKIVSFSNEAGKAASETEANIKLLYGIYGSYSDVVGDFIDDNAMLLGISKKTAMAFASYYGNIFSGFAEQETNAELTNRFLNLTSVIASKTGRTVEQVQEKITSGLFGNIKAIDDLGIFVRQSSLEMTDAFQKIANGRHWEELTDVEQQQIRAFAILEQGVQKYGTEVIDTTNLTRAKFNAAFQDFQRTWGVLVNKILIPILSFLTEILNVATIGLNRLLGLSGKTIDVQEEQVDASEETADNIGEQVENQKELNKELNKTLASFDDIEILSSKIKTNSGIDGANSILGFDFEETNKQEDVIEKAKEEIMQFAKVASGAMIAIGCLLLITGHIGFGIGLIITGCIADGITSAADDGGVTFDEIINKISTAIVIAGIVAIVLGVLLCFAGLFPYGIKLISIGVASEIAVVTVNWNTIKENIENAFNSVKDFLDEHGLLILGLILCLSVAGFPFGLALIYKYAKEKGMGEENPQNPMLEHIKSSWKEIEDFWNTEIAPVFTAQWWENLGINCINGLIAGFEGGINEIISAFETMINTIVGGLNTLSFDIPEWMGGGSFGIDIPKADFGQISIPRLAQGAVIPPNRQFLAVLGDQKQGTNIETPISTMIEAFNTALGNRQNQTVREEHYYLDENEITRIIYKLAKRGEQAQGEDLIESW